MTIRAVDAFHPTIVRYQQDIGQAAQATQRANTANQSAIGSFNGLKTALTGAIAAIGVQQFIGLAEDMNALGVKVHANSVLFTQLTKDIGGSDEVLRSLRESTGNVVSDLDLMSGASQLLRLNIVDSNRDLTELLGNIQRLKQPTESTTDAIYNFSLMLSNESMLRLDSFGISSANVKRSMDELNISFREAVMIEMDKQVERLGDAADVAQTKFGKLVVQVQNLAQIASTGVSGFVEELSGALLGEDPLQIGRTLLDQAGVNVSDFRTYVEYEQAAIEAANNHARAIANLTQQQSVYRSMLDLSAEALVAVHRRQENAIRDQRQFNTLLGLSPENQISSDIWFSTGNIQAQLEQMQALRGGMMGSTMLFTPEEAARAQVVADHMAHLVDQLDLLKGTDFVPDSTVNNVKELAKDAADFANQAQKGADAFRNMTLGQALGLSNGGMSGELSDMFMEAARSAGMAADELEHFQDVLNHGSGRETEFSQGLKEYVEQLAVSGLTAEEVNARITTLSESLRLLKEAGLESQLLTGNIDYFAGGLSGGMGRMVTLGENEGPWTWARRYNLPESAFDQLRDANGVFHPGTYPLGGMAGGANPSFDSAGMVESLQTMLATQQDMSASASEADASTQNITDNFTESRDMIAEIGNALNGIFEKTYKLKLDAIAPDWLKALLTGGGLDLAKAMADATRANGGTPPGQQAQGRSTRVIDE